jgi:hypothetical protein
MELPLLPSMLRYITHMEAIHAFYGVTDSALPPGNRSQIKRRRLASDGSRAV